MKAVLFIWFLMAAAAPAVIVSGVVPEAERLFIVGQRAYDFDGDGITDLTFVGNATNFQFLRVQPGGSGFLNTFFIVPRDSHPPALAVLSYGTFVTVASDVFGGFLGQTMQISSLYAGGEGIVHEGPWADQSGYMGFVFWSHAEQIAHYSWFRMAESGGVLELYEWAYETQDNTPIVAGQVPEPSASLTLLGSFVLLGRRRRG